MRKAFPIIALAAFAVIMVIVFVSMRPSGESAAPLNLNLPDKWQEFTRSANQTGPEALSSFQKEHAKKISWKDGVMGQYSDGKTDFTMWIAGGVNDGHANQMVLDMAARIGGSHENFKQPAAVDLGVVKAYKTEGQGRINYFYAKGRQVYWVGVKGAADPDALVKRIYPEF
ncbi:MAG TPA: hypothetical protein VNT75_11925 [Symbiobacteriaceae bacterium]|nr:hypothetical protein [Symbiobacteriaceae bacterium]